MKLTGRCLAVLGAIALACTSAPVSQAAPITFTASSGGPAVPDGGNLSGDLPGAPVTSTIIVPGGNPYVINPGNAVTITLTNWSHTWTEDLLITLTGPTGVAVTLLGNVGVACAFSPAAAYSLNSGNTTAWPLGCSGSVPGGSYATSNPTFSSSWAGTMLEGTQWTLTVQDFYSGDVQPAGWLWSATFDATPTPEPSMAYLILTSLVLGMLHFHRAGTRVRRTRRA